MASDVRRFWLKVAALVAPVLVPLAVPIAVLWKTGEFVTADQVADRMLAGESGLHYSQGCTDQWRRFKLRIASSMSPNVLVLGGSSSLQLRGDYFQQPSYNAAATVGSVWHALEFLRRIGPAHAPRMLVLGLHPYWFLENWKPWSQMFGGDFDATPPTPAAIIQSCSRQVIEDLIHGRLAIGQIANQSRQDVGMQVLLGSPGFRPDGSYDRGAPLPIPERFAPQMADARAGSNYMPFGGDLAQTRVADLRELLEYCRASGIHVIAYLPPIADAVRQVMFGSGHHYDYVLRAFDRLEPVLASYGFHLFDATDLRSIGSSDTEMLDGTHPGETADLRLLLHLVALDPSLAAYVDADRLRVLLAQASPLSVLNK